jgi:hypothetical protein
MSLAAGTKLERRDVALKVLRDAALPTLNVIANWEKPATGAGKQP